MPLFHIQDSDRPAWVFARNYAHAFRKWDAIVSRENDGEETEPPYGITYICDDGEIILDDDFVRPLEIPCASPTHPLR